MPQTTRLLREVLWKTLLEPCDHKRQACEDVGCVVADIHRAIASAEADEAINAELLAACEKVLACLEGRHPGGRRGPNGEPDPLAVVADRTITREAVAAAIRKAKGE